MPRQAIPGAFVPASTPVHALDARVKLTLLLVVTAVTFLVGSPAGVGVVALGLVLCLAASRVSPTSVLRATRPAAVVLGVSLASNVVCAFASGAAGAAALASALRGVLAVTRVILLVGYALVVSTTTTSTQVVEALAWAIAPLGRLGVPVGDVSMATSVALRFIPVCIGEFDRICCAQRARGARFDQGSLSQRAGKWVSVMVPLTVSLFRRADDLAVAMGDRCYSGGGFGGEPRPLRVADWAVLAVGCLSALAACLL